MLSKLHSLAKTMSRNILHHGHTNNTRICSIYLQNLQRPENPLSTKQEVQIFDVNMDEMVNDDSSQRNQVHELETSVSLMSPIDIDPWIDEESARQGTVDIDMMDNYKTDIAEYNDPPTNRTGSYVFKGIEIWLPKKMLTSATYRYDLENNKTAPDDIRICKHDGNE